jgi:OOP family OmpA-OmpF porin
MNKKMGYYPPSIKLLITLLAIVSIFDACKNKAAPSDPDSLIQESVQTKSIDSSDTTAEYFNSNEVKISTKPLGDFPYLGLPEGYINYEKNDIVNFDQSYFWVKGHFECPEGKIFWSEIRSKEGKAFSEQEVLRNLDELILSANGKKISSTTVLPDSLESLKSDQARYHKYLSGWGFIGYKPTSVYLIRRQDKNIWVQMTPGSDGSSLGWMVLETKPLKQSASLIKAEAIKEELDSKGHIAIYINFDTGKASVKKESQAAIDELVKLLKQNPDLRISIEGHTDNEGTKERNTKLSSARATAVEKELIAAGTVSSRLQSKGLGQDNPIADNVTEDGKAKNRRVEIVKLP